MWQGQRVSVILPTYNEKDSIAQCVRDFHATGVVDEVLEPRQGYGNAIQRGLREATGDLLVVCEPDGTFSARDLWKLLAYSADCDVVYGTRTTEEFIWTGANMGFFLKWGNYAVAKMLELMFNTVYLSDVGCTYRLVRRSLLPELEPHFTVGGSHFGPEMMLISIIKRARFVQVPVNYRTRVGVSAVTGDRAQAFVLGLRMIFMIWSFWLRSLACRLSGRELFGPPLRRSRAGS